MYSAPAPPRKTRGELMKDIDADYYGYRDEDDGVLIPLEEQEEKIGIYILSYEVNAKNVNFCPARFIVEPAVLIILYTNECARMCLLTL